MSYIKVAVGQSELGAVARLAVGIGAAVWWDLRIASLLTHFFIILFLFLGSYKSRLLCLSVPATLLYFHLYFVLLSANK